MDRKFSHQDREGEAKENKTVRAREQCLIATKQMKFRKILKRNNKSWSKKKICCNKQTLTLPKQLRKLRHRELKYYKTYKTQSGIKFSTKKKNKQVNKKHLNQHKL